MIKAAPSGQLVVIAHFGIKGFFPTIMNKQVVACPIFVWGERGPGRINQGPTPPPIFPMCLWGSHPTDNSFLGIRTDLLEEPTCWKVMTGLSQNVGTPRSVPLVSPCTLKVRCLKTDTDMIETKAGLRDSGLRDQTCAQIWPTASWCLDCALLGMVTVENSCTPDQFLPRAFLGRGRGRKTCLHNQPWSPRGSHGGVGPACTFECLAFWNSMLSSLIGCLFKRSEGVG